MSLERRALVVDDDTAIRILLARVLTRSSFLVDSAQDGAEAIEKLKANDYAIVILDLMMPRIDGAGVVKYLTDHDPRMLPRVIVLTAYGASGLKKVPAEVGRVLEKPFEVDRLLREITECYWMTSGEA
jgi:DNA-binding response OmpR family regulator